jgi:C4-dicarboxylate-specific signal transduction histidine kinase
MLIRLGVRRGKLSIEDGGDVSGEHGQEERRQQGERLCLPREEAAVCSQEEVGRPPLASQRTAAGGCELEPGCAALLELKKVQAELHRTRQQLIQAEKMSAIGSLVGSITHEFNNPLCGIRSVLARLSRKVDLEAGDRNLLQLALEQCERMERLSRGLQRFNVPFSDVRRFFDLHRVIDSVLLLLNKHLKVRRATVRKEYADGALLLVGAENQIKQVLFNLIKNSGEALPESGGDICIRTARRGEFVHITLDDTGIGISEEKLSRLFEPNFATKNGGQETCLGLSVSHSIVKGHRGEIRVASYPGRGTTISVILPVGEHSDAEEGGHGTRIHSGG